LPEDGQYITLRQKAIQNIYVLSESQITHPPATTVEVENERRISDLQPLSPPEISTGFMVVTYNQEPHIPPALAFSNSLFCPQFIYGFPKNGRIGRYHFPTEFPNVCF
jgi:hypothetical protein